MFVIDRTHPRYHRVRFRALWHRSWHHGPQQHRGHGSRREVWGYGRWEWCAGVGVVEDRDGAGQIFILYE